MLPDCAENQNQKLSGVQTSGGLKKVVDEAQEMFIFAEQWFRKTIETEGHLKKTDIKAMTGELLQDAKIVSLYKTIVGVIQMILIVKLKLIYLRISSIYLRVSSFSFAKYVTSHKKQEQKMT